MNRRERRKHKKTQEHDYRVEYCISNVYCH